MSEEFDLGKQIARVTEWVDVLHKDIERIEKRIEALERDLSQTKQHKASRLELKKLEQRLDKTNKDVDVYNACRKIDIETNSQSNATIESVLRENNRFLDSLASYFARKGEKDITLDIRTHLSRMEEFIEHEFTPEVYCVPIARLKRQIINDYNEKERRLIEEFLADWEELSFEVDVEESEKYYEIKRKWEARQHQ